MKYFILCALCLFSLSAFAEEISPFSLATSFAASPYSDEGFSLGGAFQGEYHFMGQFSGGLRLVLLHDMKNIMMFEPAAFGRWYFYDLMLDSRKRSTRNLPFIGHWDFYEIPRNKNCINLFLLAEIGASVYRRNEVNYPAVMGALGAGARLPLSDWHIEASMRVGYPFMFAGELTLGYTFKRMKKKEGEVDSGG
jgi:hypothetical protein